MGIQDVENVLSDNETTPAQKLVLIAVAVSGTATLKDISDMTGYSIRQTRNILTALTDSGLIRYNEASFEWV